MPQGTAVAYGDMSYNITKSLRATSWALCDPFQLANVCNKPAIPYCLLHGTAYFSANPAMPQATMLCVVVALERQNAAAAAAAARVVM